MRSSGDQTPTVTSSIVPGSQDDLRAQAGKDTVLMLVQRGNTPPTYRGIKLLPDKPAK
jgi:serine protease Do